MKAEKIRKIASLLSQAGTLLNEVADELNQSESLSVPKSKTPPGLYTTERIAAEFGLSAKAANMILVKKGKAAKVGHRIVPDHKLFADGMCDLKNKAPYWTEKGKEWLRHFLRKNHNAYQDDVDSESFDSLLDF